VSAAKGLTPGGMPVATRQVVIRARSLLEEATRSGHDANSSGLVVR
jgi:hypothetical protein